MRSREVTTQLPDLDFIQIPAQKVNSSWWTQRSPPFNQTRSQMLTHLIFQGNESTPPTSPCVEREQGAIEGHSSNEDTVNVCFQVYLHSYHHPVFSSTEWAQHSTDAQPVALLGTTAEGKTCTLSERTSCYSYSIPPTAIQGHHDCSKTRCQRQGQ